MKPCSGSGCGGMAQKGKCCGGMLLSGNDSY